MARYVVQESSDCADTTPWAVLDSENDNAVQGCYATQQDAQDKADELNGGGTGDGNGQDTSASLANEQRGAAWEAIAAFLDKPTDEMEPRLIHADGLQFRDLPMPLMAMFEDDHGGWDSNTTSILVGRIEAYRIDGDQLIMTGTYDASPEGERAQAWAESGSARVSVDTNPITYRVTAPRDVVLEQEQAWQEFIDQVEEAGTPEEQTPEQVVAEMPTTADGRVIIEEGSQSDYILEFVECEIMGLTMVPFSAFGETTIKVADGEGALVASGLRRVRFAARFQRVEEQGVPVALGGESQQVLGRLYGVPTDMLNAVASVASLHAPIDSPTGVFEVIRSVYDTALDAGGRFEVDCIPMPIDSAPVLWVGGESYALRREALTASGARLAPERPPRDWFDMPEPDELTPFTVLPTGQVYGHLAPWEACHLAYPGECKQPPTSESGYRYMNRGLVECDDDSLVAAGPIAVKGAHADTMLGMREAIAHYENTTRIVADVNVRDGQLGIWASGSVRADADAADVRDLRATGEVSPDWRWVDGNLEMICGLAVALGGYPVPRATALVADGHIRSLVGVQFGAEEIKAIKASHRPVDVNVRLQVLGAVAQGGLSALRTLAGA